MVVQSLISVIERVIVDAPEEYLLFLQDAFPYFEKYLVTDYLPKLVERIAFMMEQHQLTTPRDKTLLLDYKAELFVLRKEYANALEKVKEAAEALKKAFGIRKKYESKDCLDYGFCQTMFGILCYREGKATDAERHLLSAEMIIADVMGTNNDYMKTVYRYLHSLYTRWRKPELAQKYKEKYLEPNKNKIKISP